MKPLQYFVIFGVMLTLLMSINCLKKGRSQVTFVTMLIDLKKSEIDPTRTIEKYHQYFKRLILPTDSNLIIFGQASLWQFIQANRPQKNTHFIQISKSNFSQTWELALLKKSMIQYPGRRERAGGIYGMFEKIPNYFGMALRKIPLIQQAMKQDPFHSDFYHWIDAGINHIFEYGFWKQNTYEDFQIWHQQPFHFHTTWMQGKERFYSFGSFQELRYVKERITWRHYVMGGYFGGRAQVWPNFAKIYQNFLRVILETASLFSKNISIL